jgi:hypothetical protein
MLILALILALAIGEGVHPVRMFESVPAALLTVALLTMIVGQIAAWKREGIGSVLILGSFVLFAVVGHGIAINLVFCPWLLTGLLYLACGWMRGKAASLSPS